MYEEFVMRKVSAVVFAVGLAASGLSSAAPVEMTDQQLDQVTAGALLNVVAVDLVDVNNNNIAVSIPVNAAIAIGVLGGAIAGAAQGQPGRITQSQ